MREYRIRGYIIYPLNTVKLGPLPQYQSKEGDTIMSEMTTQMDLACERLRTMIRNEQQVERNAQAWRKLESQLRRVYVSGTNVSNIAKRSR